MLYCDEGKDFIFMAFNMHWASHSFALPILPKGINWYYQFDTSKDFVSGKISKEQKTIVVKDRSIIILIGK